MSDQPEALQGIQSGFNACMFRDTCRRQHSRIEADEVLMKAALSALEESIDIVGEDYRTDWRHGLPTRKAQLDGKKDQLDAHEAAITALRTRLDQAK